MVKNPPANVGDMRDMGSISGSERFPWSRKWQPLQYSYLENTLEGGTWRAIVPGIAESDMTEATLHATEVGCWLSGKTLR